jgi:hypothetical protein
MGVRGGGGMAKDKTSKIKKNGRCHQKKMKK